MQQEILARLGSFVAALAVLGWLEAARPRRPRVASKARRWTANLGIVAVDTLAVRLLVPLLPVALAALCQEKGLGLLPLLGLTGVGGLVLTLLVLDLAIYYQHRAFHHFRLLWRLHRMHHADLDLDVTSALRFHPGEILLSVVYKLALVALLGPAPLAVLIFEVGLNVCAMFNHANVALPLALDRAVRLALVTPDMHRVHHSTDMREANTNFGFNFPWWDRLLGTYKAQPDKGHENMVIGLNIFREPKFMDLWWMLAQPFLSGRNS